MMRLNAIINNKAVPLPETLRTNRQDFPIIERHVLYLDYLIYLLPYCSTSSVNIFRHFYLIIIFFHRYGCFTI